jgi:hypothetical protein
MVTSTYPNLKSKAFDIVDGLIQHCHHIHLKRMHSSKFPSGTALVANVIWTYMSQWIPLVDHFTLWVCSTFDSNLWSSCWKTSNQNHLRTDWDVDHLKLHMFIPKFFLHIHRVTSNFYYSKNYHFMTERKVCTSYHAFTLKKNMLSSIMWMAYYSFMKLL